VSRGVTKNRRFGQIGENQHFGGFRQRKKSMTPIGDGKEGKKGISPEGERRAKTPHGSTLTGNENKSRNPGGNEKRLERL